VKALVTRPREDAGELAAALAERGIEPVIEPLLSIRFAADGAAVLAPLLAGAQAVLFTSANGVRAFAAATDGRALPVFAVGDATAMAAREAGFAEVASADGAVADLADMVRRRLKSEDGALVHAAGSDVAGDLAAALGQSGFELRRARLYEAVAAERLSAATSSQFAAGEIALALFFSPRTAETFVRLAREAGLERGCRSGTAIALSPAVADRLQALPWRAVLAAEAPTTTALLGAVDRVLAAGASGGGSMTEDSAAPQPTSAPPRLETQPAASRPPRRRGVGAWVLSVLIVAFAMVGSTPYWAPSVMALLPWGEGAPAAPQLGALESRLSAAETARRASDERVARLEAQMKAQQNAPQAAPDPAALRALGQRIDALERRPEPTSAPPPDTQTPQALQALQDTQQKTVARLDAFDARLSQAATLSASDAADLRLLAALADLRAALAASVPFEAELMALAALGQGDAAIADALKPLAADAATGIANTALLGERFRAETAPAIRRAAAPAAAADDGSFGDRVLARVLGLVTIRRIGDDGTPVAAAVRGAGAALDKGDLAAAIAALGPLDGAAADAARPWVAAAQHRIDAEKSVADLSRRIAGRMAQAAPAKDSR